MGLALAISLAVAFSATNGLHDAADAVATLVATRGARPGQAILLSSVFNVLGALVMSAAVAGTIAGIVSVRPGETVAVVGSGAFAATAWNLLTWGRGLPSSSGHALVGGLVGAAFAQAGLGAVRWGGLHGIEPRGVGGTLVALAVSPLVGFLFALAVTRADLRLLRRATRRVLAPIRAGEWVMSAALSFSHGANDGQKAMGVIAAALLATGHLHSFAVPLWVRALCAVALTLGTSLGGWRIIRTVGRRIFRLGAIDALASQSSSTAVILAASFVGGPVSTTHVVASSVVGVGAGRRRWRHVRWAVVRSMAFAWIATLPASALIGAGALLVWSGIE
jgi:inorganic phosphate transporter, PiT family